MAGRLYGGPRRTRLGGEKVSSGVQLCCAATRDSLFATEGARCLHVVHVRGARGLLDHLVGVLVLLLGFLRQVRPCLQQLRHLLRAEPRPAASRTAAGKVRGFRQHRNPEKRSGVRMEVQ